MARREELTDEQWTTIQPLIPEPPRRPDGRGRPWRDARAVLNGILWILRSGARWQDLPECFTPYQTCHRRFQQWVRDGTLRSILEALAADLRERGEFDLSECFIDATFVVAKKGGPGVGTTKRGKGTKLMAVADRTGLPLAVHMAAATPHEVTLVPDTLAQTFTTARPARLIGDKAYDSDPLDAELAAVGIELIAPHRANRRQPATQDRRPLRRYRRRWKIERLFAWLQNFRRLLVRHEYHAENFLGFVHLGCMVILLRYYLSPYPGALLPPTAHSTFDFGEPTIIGSHGDRRQYSMDEIGGRAVFVPRHVMMHQGRSGIPDAAGAKNSYLTITGPVLKSTSTEPTGMDPAMQQDRMLAEFQQGALERLRGRPDRERPTLIEPADIENLQAILRGLRVGSASPGSRLISEGHVTSGGFCGECSARTARALASIDSASFGRPACRSMVA